MEVLTFILAGGRGKRLDPLTRDRTKPAVPFAGVYRIIDFTLSNCINSGLRRIYILTQYKSFSLQKHLLGGWNIVSNQLGEFIDIIPAQQRISTDWYQGTADAIYQNIYAIHDCDPKLILILAGDHIYKMDYRKMISNHNKNEADMTVACVPLPRETSKHFGVIEVDQEHCVLGFQEKPDDPQTIPGQDDKIFASLGIYLFKSHVLLEEIKEDAEAVGSEHDFGKNIIPHMIRKGKKVIVHNFVNKRNRPLYWRDIGTRDAYFQAHMDLLESNPELNLYDKTWPVRTYHEQYPPIKIASSKTHEGSIKNSIISGGCMIEGAFVEHSVLSPNVWIKNDVEIKNSVIMEGVVIGEKTKIQNTIIDKSVLIPSESRIGYDMEKDKQRFDLTSSGIVIVAKKAKI